MTQPNTQPGPYGTELHRLAEGIHSGAAQVAALQAQGVPGAGTVSVEIPTGPTPNAIAPELGAYLAPILERWRIAKLEADAATERADALGREVKDACTAAQLPTTTLTDTAGRPVARYESTEGWRLDTTRLKAEQAPIYAAYAKPTTTTRLVAVK